MTPQERLKEIEKEFSYHIGLSTDCESADKYLAHTPWLIARVKQLEEALKEGDQYSRSYALTTDPIGQ